MCCGSVLVIAHVGEKALKQLFGARYVEFKRLSTIEKHHVCLVANSGRTTTQLHTSVFSE